MTLLELLRQELPKRGGWPEGVNYIAQDEGRATWSFIDKPAKDEDDEWMDDSETSYHKLLGHLPEASDYRTAIVTREQYEATGWDGTGLPPVGVECEYKWQNDRWRVGKVCYISKHTVLMLEIFDGEESESAYGACDVTFRPLRTEAERAIDEMVRLSGVSIGAAKILYDAGYRK